MKNAGNLIMIAGVCLMTLAVRGWEMDFDLPAGEASWGWALVGALVIYAGYRVSVWLDAGRKAR